MMAALKSLLKNSYDVCPLVSAYFIWHNVIQVYPHCSMCQNLIFLKAENILLYVYVTFGLSIHQLMDTGLLHILAIVNSAVMNIGV